MTGFYTCDAMNKNQAPVAGRVRLALSGGGFLEVTADGRGVQVYLNDEGTYQRLVVSPVAANMVTVETVDVPVPPDPG